MNSADPCYVVVATKDRLRTLVEQCLPSVRRQSYPPVHLVVVNDGEPLGAADRAEVVEAAAPLPVSTIPNRRAPGAAGAWNTGLLEIDAITPPGSNPFVAFLDDDDTWEEDHLAANVHAARTEAGSEPANVVVSGLRLNLDGKVQDRPPINSLCPRTFLTGNPGWQGSNTFVKLDLLLGAGGFRDRLLSANDRDLAIRLLRHPQCRTAFTGRWTATWHLHTDGEQLSTRGGLSKRQGLRWFWHLYGQEMTPAEADSFFERALVTFGIRRSTIEAPGPDLPPLRTPAWSLPPLVDAPFKRRTR